MSHADMFKYETLPQSRKKHTLVVLIVPHLKSVYCPLVEEIGTTDASKKEYWNHLNDLPFTCKWPGKKERKTHINLLNLDMVLKTCLKFEDEIKGITVSFQINNTRSGGLSDEEGSIHCKKFNYLVRKIFLKYHRDDISWHGIPRKSKGRCLIQRQKGRRVESRGPHLMYAIGVVGVPVVHLFSSIWALKVPQYFSQDLSDKRALGEKT